MTQLPPVTRTIKWLVGTNVFIWFFGMLIWQNFVLHDQEFFARNFGLVPRALFSLQLWRPVTYMFLHGSNITHILFNMLILWWIGAELELKWGRKFFLTYYFVSGIGAAIIYLIGVFTYAVIAKDAFILEVPVIGASGAVYGLLVAFGMLFGERPIYFMMLFPMKAKHFVFLIGFIELATLLQSGMGSDVANLAHLGGILAGFLFLKFWTDWRFRFQRVRNKVSRGRRLKLVVNNESSRNEDQPKYWN